MQVYLGLGSNLGHREETLHRALEMIKERVGKIVSLSAFYETEPYGFESENLFLNAACCVETSLSPLEILSATQTVECELGRTSKSADGIHTDRVVDIDILLLGDLEYVSGQLTIPHPKMHERDFVLAPLCEIAPFAVHPVLGKTVKALAGDVGQ